MTDSFEQQVNDATSKMVQSDEGKWDFPPDLELAPEVKYAANLERRRRDTQTAFARANQEAKALRAEAEALAQGWEQNLGIDETQQAELEELKHTDPDAWRQKLNEIEQVNRSKFQEKRTEIASRAQQESELDRRTRLMEEFSAANPEIALTDEVIADEIPPKYLKKLERGESTFEEFLDECKSYLTKGRTLSPGTEAPQTPNLATSGGSSVPTDQAVESDIRESYKNEVY